MKRSFIRSDRKVIFNYSQMYCDTPEQLLKSELFADIVENYLERISSTGNSLFAFFQENIEKKDMTTYIINIFRLLSNHTAEEVISIKSDYRPILTDKEYLLEIVEGLYNHWRRFERYLYIDSPGGPQYSKESIHHHQFIESNERFRRLVLYTYRRIRENLTGKNPSAYRQLPAGANMGMLIEKINWDVPFKFTGLKDVPFIRLSLIEPPLIIYSKRNTRKGKFEEKLEVAADMFYINPDDWYCYPAKIGALTAFIYFHYDFISQGLSLSNLFELAESEDIDGKKPDMIILYGLRHNSLTDNTYFFEDVDSKILVGLVKHTDDIDYFGYFKKLPLTLHNIVMLKKGRLPLHGAMAHIKLGNAVAKSIIIVGDSGAGKSETLEALRALAGENVCEMTIIFDDMGSLGLDEDGRVSGYGTEIGAFVRLDDLQPQYAYKEIDRSIFMNPDRQNARLIIPITHYHHIVRGYTVDMIFYANNYELTENGAETIEFFNDAEEALAVFKSGARMAKGTTDETGLVHTYFANPFGAPQRREKHEELASFYFNKMFDSNIRIGQIRTRLGIKGYEQEGPKAVAVELLNILKEE